MRSSVFVATSMMLLTLASTQASTPAAAPEFTHSAAVDWLNSTPLTVSKLRGKPILIEFWTFDCINCLRSLDWMKSMAQRNAQGLTIVAVHTPELAQERVPDNVRNAVRKLGITYPVMLDRDFSYWNAIQNQYWPAFYLVDGSGRVRSQVIGELHVGDRRARDFEREIDRVLAGK